MKRISTLCLLLFFAISVFSQNIIDRKVSFEYIRLPLQPIKKSIKNYQSKVELEYESLNKIRKDAFAKIVVDYEKKYQDEMTVYDNAVKDAGVKYAQEMTEYNKKVKAGQTNLQQPVLNLPANKPEKYIPVDNNYYPRQQNADLLASTYIKLDGYNKSPDNAVMLIVLLKGFQYSEPEIKTAQTTKTKDGVKVTETEYWYEYKYKYPMGLKVDVPGDGIVFFEYFPELDNFASASTAKYKTEAELKAAFNRDKVFSELEERLIAQNLTFVNMTLCSKFGYTRTRADERISLVEGKKYSYTDYQQAFEAALSGLNNLTADMNKTNARQSINSGVSIWENALKESKPQDKKARINGNVTVATLFNIALVSIYADDFARAELYLNKVLSTDASKKEQRRVEQMRAFMRDMQARYEAWKKMN